MRTLQGTSHPRQACGKQPNMLHWYRGFLHTVTLWLTTPHLQEGSDAVLRLCPLQNVWGFIDPR